MPLVMIIDDEPGIAFIMERILQKSNFETLSAGNGALGLELFQKRTPDLVIVDEMMPDMRGGEVCRRIKQLSPQTPVLLCSASLMVTDHNYVQEVGANEAMAKPIRPAELVAVVKRLLPALTADSAGQDSGVQDTAPHNPPAADTATQDEPAPQAALRGDPAPGSAAADAPQQASTE